MDNFSSAFVPLAWMVDIVPQLRYLPEGFPGASFKKTAREWYEVTRKVYDAPFSFVQELMAAGTNRPSFVSSLIERLRHGSEDGELCKEDEEAIKQSAAILYGGGADTTISSLTSFTLAMLLFPEVQRKAQREIDNVVGSSRLPSFEIAINCRTSMRLSKRLSAGSRSCQSVPRMRPTMKSYTKAFVFLKERTFFLRSGGSSMTPIHTQTHPSSTQRDSYLPATSLTRRIMSLALGAASVQAGSSARRHSSSRLLASWPHSTYEG